MDLLKERKKEMNFITRTVYRSCFPDSVFSGQEPIVWNWRSPLAASSTEGTYRSRKARIDLLYEDGSSAVFADSGTLGGDVRNEDGFLIAKADLELRGSGEFL